MDLAPLLALLPHLGLDAEHVLAWVTIAMTALTVLAKVLDYLVPRLQAYAKTTPQTWDDRLAMRLAWVLGLLHAILPRVAVGPRNPRRGEDAIGPMMVLLLTVGLAGCAGPAALAGEGARATACIAVETKCIERAEAGDITLAEAEACVSCARATCDAIREEMAR